MKKKEQTDSMVITLENAIYMGMKNDLAFIIDTELFLYEHQSTYNPNMPLRDLFYISSEYQKLVDKKSLYSSVLQKIPAPQFIVFYNGTEKKKDSWVNHLSEAFENLSGNPKLELEVLTININEGHNSELMEQCQILREYAQYVDCVRRYFNFLGRYIPPSLQPVPLTPEEQEELRKKEERKDRLHQNYLKRKASGAQKRYEDKIKAKKKAEMDAKKALIRAEDMKKGVFSTIGQLPKEEPRKGSIAASAAV